MHLSEMALRDLGFQPADVMNLVQDFVNKENNRPGSTKCNPWTKVYLALGKKKQWYPTVRENTQKTQTHQ